MELMFLLAITAARRSIEISSSYFVPDRMTRAALVAARMTESRLRHTGATVSMSPVSVVVQAVAELVVVEPFGRIIVAQPARR